MTHENETTHPTENHEPTAPQSTPTQRSRRGLFKAGAMLIPTLVTLRAEPAWGACNPPTSKSCYGMSRRH